MSPPGRRRRPAGNGAAVSRRLGGSRLSANVPLTTPRPCDGAHADVAMLAAEARRDAGLPPRPPLHACPWCAAAPGVQCHVVGPGRRALTHRTDGCHPSRTDVAA